MTSYLTKSMDYVEIMLLEEEPSSTNNFEARSYTGSPSAINGGPDIVLGWETIEIDENNEKVFQAYPYAKVLSSPSPPIGYDDPYDNKRFFKEPRTVSSNYQIIALNLIFVLIMLFLVSSLIFFEKGINNGHLRGTMNKKIYSLHENYNDKQEVNIAGVIVIAIIAYAKKN